MNKPLAHSKRPLAYAGGLVLGHGSAVIGTILDHEFLATARGRILPCDLVELRLDGFRDLTGWSRAAAGLERESKPVLATVRLTAEGGHWQGRDEDRLPIFEEALATVTGIDIELRSPLAAGLGAQARELNKLCVVSHHDFERTPPAAALEDIVRRGQEIGSVVKIAAMIQTPADIEVLRGLLQRAWLAPLCIIGMGPLGRETRLSFPAEGSCLAYGYLDTPGAPGQYSAAELQMLVNRRASEDDDD